MSKYDFEIDLSNNSSTGIILNKIKKGSAILEFGCATGRMTRYMKEVLECRVYIVEYEEGAYREALKYAEDGLCDDIMNFQWLEKFEGIEFDAIILADVLEHLKNPEKVLKEASSLLKDGGYIYVSIPNITHNDIILKACGEHFDYTKVGILDDTHVHFWGADNLKLLAEEAGLCLSKAEGTYCPTGYTEQYNEAGIQGAALLANILKERRCGEVYQFVLTLAREYCGEPEYVFKVPSIQSHLYTDTGTGFNGSEVVTVESEYTGAGYYHAHYVINNVTDIKSVRFDPVEFQGCILENISITQGKDTLLIAYHNGLELESGLLMPGEDPMLWVNVTSLEAPLVIDADITLINEKYIRKAEKALVDKYSECTALSGQVERITAGNRMLEQELTDKAREIVCLQKETDRLREDVARMTEESGELRRELGAYIILANNKDKYAIELTRELNARTQDIHDLIQNVQELSQIVDIRNSYIAELEAALNYYRNLKVVKIRVLLARIVKGVARRVRRVLRRVLRKEER